MNEQEKRCDIIEKCITHVREQSIGKTDSQIKKIVKKSSKQFGVEESLIHRMCIDSGKRKQCRFKLP